MNEVSKTINYCVNWFANDKLVNTVTMTSDYEFDTHKDNIYILVNINYLRSSIRDNRVISYFDITAVQQRNVEPIPTDSKLAFDTNLIDNLNETHTVLNKLIRNLQLQNNAYNIEIDSLSDLEVLKDKAPNRVDGYKMNIALSIPNETSGC